jgi:hypothetical protein
MTWPTAHQTERSVRSHCFCRGRNSRNMAPSTGKLPPTPNPIMVTIAHHLGCKKTSAWVGRADRGRGESTHMVKLTEAPAMIPKTPETTSVAFQANRRPTISALMPQKKAPRMRPTSAKIGPTLAAQREGRSTPIEKAGREYDEAYRGRESTW